MLLLIRGRREGGDAVTWYYWDNEGVEQGPYTSAEMGAWYIGEYLSPDLNIRWVLASTQESSDWAPLGEMYPDPATSFPQ